MSRARELAKVGGKNQQVIAGLSSHVGVSTFADNVFMYSNLEVTGTTAFNGGTLTLGDNASDNVVFGADVNSHIIPNTDDTYDLGSSTQEWRNLYIDGTANIDTGVVGTMSVGDLTDNRVVIAGTSGELEDSASLTFDGTTLATTNATFSGNVDLGNATSDTITATARFDSDLVPSTDNARDLGASGLEWKDLYLDGTANIDALSADSATLATAAVSDLTDGRVVLAGTSGELEDSGNLTFDGSTLTVTGALAVSGQVDWNGDINLGNATGDTVTLVGRFDSDLDPSADNTYDLGGSGLEWKDIYIDGTAYLDTAQINQLNAHGNGFVSAGSSIIPDTDDTYDLGSSSKMWRDVWIGPGSLYVNGQKVIEESSSNIVVSADANQNVVLQTHGSGDLELDPTGTGVIQVKGTLQVEDGKSITNSAGNDITLGNNLRVDQITTQSDNTNLNLSGRGSGNVTVNDNLAITGDLSVTGGSISIGTNGITATTINATGVATATQFVGAVVGSTISASSNVDFNGDLDVDGTTNLDVVDIDGAVDMASSLTLAGNADFNGDLDVDGTTNLDAVDIDGAVDMASSLTLAGNADFNGNLDVDGTTNLDGTNIAGALAVSGSATVDNLSLDGNTITTSSGNLTIDSNGGTTTINDNAIISGNLTVNGTTTTINSTTVNIDDKNFQVATGAADDAAADGAGFTVDSGDGDKTWNFEATGDNWGSSENINLASGKVLKVNNTSILSSTTLGSSVVTSSLTSLGTIGTGVWQGTAINDTYLGTIDNANKVSLSALNIDGGTDIGAALVDADEIIVDDGGGGTNRRSDMSRVKTYIYGAMSGDATASSGGAVTLAASGVSAGTVGSSTAIPIITVDAKGRVTNTSTTAVDSTTIANGSASVAVASNGPITSTGNHDFTAGIDVTGNITVSGTVDGRDVASDGSKLDGIESGATADQSANEILTLIKTIDGSGSGLDADTLDGISSASFLRSDTSDTFSGTLTVSGNILPNANGTRDLGASGTRWANVYSSDLDLSNEAKGGNTIDGSWGSYLIEEGEEHLYLTNRRSGKKYKFMLEEV